MSNVIRNPKKKKKNEGGEACRAMPFKALCFLCVCVYSYF